MRALFALLAERNIRYVHFKSTPRLDESFAGETDFDLLVHPEDAPTLRQVLAQYGFKPRHSTQDRHLPQVEDYLYYDPQQAGLHHFHVHYQLLFGKKYRKQYVFEFAEVAPHITFNEEYGLNIVSPEFESFLALLRLADKAQPGLLSTLKQPFRRDPLVGELSKLLQKVEAAGLHNWLNTFYPDFAGPMIETLYASEHGQQFGPRVLTQHRRRVLPLMQRLKRAADDAVDAEEAERMAAIYSAGRGAWLRQGGLTVAIVGIDGSGKSSLVRDLHGWLRRKLAVRVMYLGFSKGDRLQRIAALAGALARRLGLPSLAERSMQERHLRIANLRLYTWRQADAEARQHHRVVIFDRFPLREFWDSDGVMDGPKLPAGTSAGVHEREIYGQIAPYPGLLLVLDTTPEVAHARKPITPLSVLEKKAAAVSRLANISSGQVVHIDASQPYETVLAEAKAAIWSRL